MEDCVARARRRCVAVDLLDALDLRTPDRVVAWIADEREHALDRCLDLYSTLHERRRSIRHGVPLRVTTPDAASLRSAEGGADYTHRGAGGQSVAPLGGWRVATEGLDPTKVRSRRTEPPLRVRLRRSARRLPWNPPLTSPSCAGFAGEATKFSSAGSLLRSRAPTLDSHPSSRQSCSRRLVRAKRKVKAAGIPFRVPADHLLPDQLVALLAVAYLIFTEGYGGRGELAAEALRLGRALAELMPDEPEVHGLLAMMLLLDARREARFRGRDLVLLADQDPSLWTAERIAHGRATLDRPLALHGRGPYVMQAAIASLHADEPRDWPQIAALYGALARLTESPVVELSRAVAVAEEHGPEAGLDIVDRLALADYHYLHSTRGELLRRLDRPAEAREAYRRALALVHDDAERRMLEWRLAELGTAGSGMV